MLCLLRVDRMLFLIELVLLHKRLLDVPLKHSFVIESQVGS
jgi:hypothetical protein